MHKIILDTDPGVDDAQAIAFALAHPQIQLLGLTTVFGNADVELTTINALKLLELFGHPEIPVAQGAGTPMQQKRFPSADFVHGKDALGNINLPPAQGLAHTLTGAEFIVESANQHPGELSLVAIGPLTNLAQALQLDPELPNKIREVVVMGGSVVEPGNVSPVAEANFIGDPHAADAVVTAGWPLSVIGLDVTHQTLLRDQDLLHLKQRGTAVGDFLWNSSRFYFDFYRQALGLAADSESQAPMHDASALVYLVERDAFEMQHGAARVVPDGLAIGQLLFDRMGIDYFLPHWKNLPKISFASAVNAEQVRSIFIDSLTL